ncbi:prevent-host-death protein [Aphanothece hegewaldii CCALA 016]|uniref:Prevent-host-death protein n=1 Tax=Aphanothece hegewaldii CCALA 016 TaxID=2107694 RepID=A0A2T1M0A8_9CHRO|nr:prevent-host-death protein [Aphanothece hegewaldii]PSF38082.1 prevent-host-death protein [Aphanothece hegewaldii CCALA 016]
MLEKVGIREFRDHLAKYLNTASPVAVMRHGQTVGYFLPAQQEPAEAEIEGLKRAALKLDALLQEKGLTEDLLVEEFRQLREQER